MSDVSGKAVLITAVRHRPAEGERFMRFSQASLTSQRPDRSRGLQ